MENVSASHHPEVAEFQGATPQLATDQTVRVVPTAQLMSQSVEGTGVDENDVGWEGSLLQFSSMSQEENRELSNTENHPLAFEEIDIKPNYFEISHSPDPVKGVIENIAPACSNIISSEQPDNFKELGHLAKVFTDSLSAEEDSRFENPVESNVGHLHELVENNLNANHDVSKVKEGVQNNTSHENKQQKLVSFEKEFISFIGKELVSTVPAAQSSGVSGRCVVIGEGGFDNTAHNSSRNDGARYQDSGVMNLGISSAENESQQCRISTVSSSGSDIPAERQASSSEPFILGSNWTVGPDGRRFTSCPVCSRTFYKMHGLAAHYATHSAPKPFPCSTCDKRFSTAAYLKTHMIEHTRKREPRKPHKNFGKVFGCVRCSIGFSTSSRLKKHRCGPEGEAASCSGCGRVYKGSGALSLHMRFHCPVTKTKVCDLCGKCFDCPEKLANHRKRHSGSHPYACLACSSWFKSREGVNKHCVKHAAEQQELSSSD